jgi:hypothetical protein
MIGSTFVGVGYFCSLVCLVGVKWVVQRYVLEFHVGSVGELQGMFWVMTRKRWIFGDLLLLRCWFLFVWDEYVDSGRCGDGLGNRRLTTTDLPEP